MAAAVADVRLLDLQQFVLLAPGFMLLWWGVLRMARATRRPAVLALAPWKIPLMALMTLGSFGVHVTLAVMSFRRGLRMGGFLFLVGIVCMLAMAGMARGEQRIALQWVEQSINWLGQGAFALGCVGLERSLRG